MALVLLLCASLVLGTHGQQQTSSVPFFFTSPLPSNDHSCACLEIVDPSCEALGYVRVPSDDAAIITDTLAFSPCMCWPAHLTTNTTFNVFAYCNGRQNTIAQLHTHTTTDPDDVCTGAVSGLATCHELSASVFLYKEMRVVLPSGQIVSSPRHAKFAGSLRLEKSMPARVNATWAFFPNDMRCRPFSFTVSSPPQCVYDPRAIEWRFTEADVTLNTLLWAGVMAAFTIFLGSGGVVTHPQTSVVFLAGVLVAYVPCAYNLGYSQLLVALAFAMCMCAAWFVLRCALTTRRDWWVKFRIPGPEMWSGVGAVAMFYLFQLLIMALMIKSH